MVCSKAFKVLIRKKFYLPGAIVTFIFIFSLLSVLQEFLFFSPFAFFVPQSEELIFVLILLIAILSGLTIPLEVYKILNYKFTISNMKEFLAVILGVGAGCGCSVAFSIITVTGFAGSQLIGFLNAYQNPIRIIAILLLVYSFYAQMKFLYKLYCK